MWLLLLCVWCVALCLFNLVLIPCYRGTMMIGKKAVTVKSLLLLAAGSGITPMLQVRSDLCGYAQAS